MNNLDIFFQVTFRLSNNQLSNLVNTMFWPLLSKLASNQDWWYQRVEYLINDSALENRAPHPENLKWRSGGWNLVYKSLSENGCDFNRNHNYRSSLLISVLLEIGADPSQYNGYSVSGTCDVDNLEGVKMLLEDGRADPDGTDGCLLYAIENENREMIELLLEDGRENPKYNFSDAVLTGDEVIVSMMLVDERVDPSYSEDNNPTPLCVAIRYNYLDIAKMILADPRTKVGISNDGFSEAVAHEYLDIVRLMLPHQSGYMINQALESSCKFGSVEMVKLLLSPKNLNLIGIRDKCLMLARRYKRVRYSRYLTLIIIMWEEYIPERRILLSVRMIYLVLLQFSRSQEITLRVILRSDLQGR